MATRSCIRSHGKDWKDLAENNEHPKKTTPSMQYYFEIRPISIRSYFIFLWSDAEMARDNCASLKGCRRHHTPNAHSTYMHAQLMPADQCDTMEL